MRATIKTRYWNTPSKKAKEKKGLKSLNLLVQVIVKLPDMVRHRHRKVFLEVFSSSNRLQHTVEGADFNHVKMYSLYESVEYTMCKVVK